MTNIVIKPETVKKVSKWLKLFSDEGAISVVEFKEIISQLKYISEKSEIKPLIMPKLMKKDEAAKMMDIGLTKFKQLEKLGDFPFKRRKIGSSVRYLNTDVFDFITSSTS